MNAMPMPCYVLNPPLHEVCLGWKMDTYMLGSTHLRWLGKDIAEIIFSKFISGPVLKKNYKLTTKTFTKKEIFLQTNKNKFYKKSTGLDLISTGPEIISTGPD
jgi:hypothetical protein